MLFKDDFYTIKGTSQEGEATTFNVDISKNHSIFKGHFPGNPVTPGVAQMEMVKELVSEVSGEPMNLISMGNCKFLAILNPEENNNVDVILNINENEDQQLKVSAVIKNDEKSFLKMAAVYSKN
jgi:3-hydroxyacyl-[acyl-carrier-protein] dehydratase